MVQHVHRQQYSDSMGFCSIIQDIKGDACVCQAHGFCHLWVGGLPEPNQIGIFFQISLPECGNLAQMQENLLLAFSVPVLPNLCDGIMWLLRLAKIPG